MATFLIVERYTAVQYDGTNSAEIGAMLNHFAVNSEQDGVLMFTDEGVQHTVNTNDWVRATQGMLYGVFTPYEFGLFYYPLQEI